MTLEQAWNKRNKLRAEGAKLRTEGDKLCAEGDKLWTEGDLIFIDAVIATYGNVEIMWHDDESATVESITYH